MLVILLVGFVAACAAAPRFPHGPPPFHPQPYDARPGVGPQHYDPFTEELFDTRQFWAEMANEMRQLDTLLAQFYEKFPAISSTQGVVGNEYKINIPLSGFEENEIVVKAREGILMVQAVQKLDHGGERSYLDIKTLPTIVNVTGSWTFENDLLKISFPLKADAVTEVPVTEPVSESFTDHSREELGGDGDIDLNASTGTDIDMTRRGDESRDRELITNEIPRNSAEATTYAVDLKDEVEFVPVRYR